MKPPYEILSKILKLLKSISEKLGEAMIILLEKTSPQLRNLNIRGFYINKILNISSLFSFLILIKYCPVG